MPALLAVFSFTLLFLMGCGSQNGQQRTSPTDSTRHQGQPTASRAENTAPITVGSFLIIPGQQVGPIRANSTESGLLAELGTSVVTVRDTLYDNEGNSSLGTTLYKGTANQAHILWKDTGHFARPAVVQVRPQSLDTTEAVVRQVSWITRDGLRYGMNLKEVERLNGGPFMLYGFDWDYGGYVINWRGGRLQGPGPQTMFLLQFTYRMPWQGKTLTPGLEKTLGKLRGDTEFISSTPAMQQLNPRVASMNVSFPE